MTCKCYLLLCKGWLSADMKPWKHKIHVLHLFCTYYRLLVMFGWDTDHPSIISLSHLWTLDKSIEHFGILDLDTSSKYMWLRFDQYAYHLGQLHNVKKIVYIERVAFWECASEYYKLALILKKTNCILSYAGLKTCMETQSDWEHIHIMHTPMCPSIRSEDTSVNCV